MKRAEQRLAHIRWLKDNFDEWIGEEFGPRTENKRRIFELMQRDGLYSSTTVWYDTAIDRMIAEINSEIERPSKECTGVISSSAWTAMTPKEKSKLMELQWGFKGAAESLGAAWQVVRLLTSWGYSVDWEPLVDHENKPLGGFICTIDVATRKPAKVDLTPTADFGMTLAEAVCAAGLRSVGLIGSR